MKAYKFTFKDRRVWTSNTAEEKILMTKNLTAEELFRKYMMITDEKAYMSGMIKLINIEEV